MDVIIRLCRRRNLDGYERAFFFFFWCVHAITCAEKGDVGFFKKVALEILLKARYKDDDTVLTVAAIQGHLDCCEVIVARCTQLLYHQESRAKRSVLHHVVEYKGNNNVENIMRFLITADSKPDLEFGRAGKELPNKRLLMMQDEWGRTALHLAVIFRKHWATKLLLEADHDFELLRMVDNDGRTCLHSAAEHGDYVSAEFIITKARPDIEFLKMTERQSNQTALHIAVKKEKLAIVQTLLEVGNCNDLLAVVDSEQQTALHYAVKQGNLGVVKLMCKAGLDEQLLSMPDSEGNTPLHLAVRNNNLEIVKLLIEGDMVVDYCANNSNKTLLLLAMDKAAARDGSSSEIILKLLLGKVPSLTGDMGWRLLYHAASHGLISVVQDIIRLRADCINTVDSYGQNVLHIVAYHGHLDVVQQFLKSKDTDVVALLNTRDRDGNTPYMMAMEKILSNGYGECSKSDSEIIRMLLEKDPEQCKIRTGDTGLTYLHLATSRGHLSIIKDIIQLCPDCLKLEDTHKQTFIHIAAEHGFVNVAEFILESKEVENTMLNAQDKDGNTPLHIAALNKNQKATLCLLYDARVNKGIENDKKEKAIDLIDFPYDEAKARVYSLGHQRDLKDQSSFDLLVATLIATVSFAAGITMPGGYVSDGVNKGSAILLKATAFKVFIVSNNFALLFSLYTVFLNFSTRRLLKEEDIYYESSMGTFRTRLLLKKKDMIYQLNTATLCTLSAVYAMVVAFITGSYAVLANSDGLAITVCVSSCFFLILASHATWTMAMQYWRSKPVPKVSS